MPSKYSSRCVDLDAEFLPLRRIDDQRFGLREVLPEQFFDRVTLQSHRHSIADDAVDQRKILSQSLPSAQVDRCSCKLIGVRVILSKKAVDLPCKSAGSSSRRPSAHSITLYSQRLCR